MAVWMTHLGLDVDFVSAVGDDVLGQWVRTQLHAFGVRDKQIQTIAGDRTGTCVILVDETGARTMMPDFAANLQIQLDDKLRDLIADADIVVMSAYSFLRSETQQMSVDIAQLVNASPTRLVIDAASSSPIRHRGATAVRAYLALADIVLANEDEFEALAEDASPDWTSEFANLVIKRGDRGAKWLPRGKVVADIGAEQVQVIDTTGAGDAFCAGMVTVLADLKDWSGLTGEECEQALRAGAKAAADNCQHIGAVPIV
jgi:sugar/nucleoside kinase (ribokinase family)